ncbi:Alpha/Beta hydrolase protein [Amanita rubescens]|nr:Alpha/Beta hydrolase protein [Amanita rubescens]
MWPAILPSPLRLLLASFLFPSYASQNTLQFYLRHEHAVSATNHIVFADVPGKSLLLDAAATPFVVNTIPLKTHRPSSLLAHSQAIRRSREHAESSLLDWWGEEVQGPDVESRESLLTLAKMTFDAYLEPSDKEWYELDSQWNKTHPFGWEADADGFRGHIFVSTDNSTVVISIKGTSAGWILGGGPTAQKDKLNDNLLFSCCCARVGPTWSTVCDCFSGGYRCDQTCIENALIGESLFYPIGMNLYYNVSYMYPDANIWIVGHSLGGALASLVGVTFGTPVVAFEAPGERSAAQRLHLPSPPSTQHITHVYHTADPIAMGTCNGITSSCALAGYAMETRCHLGKSVVFDTIGKKGWSADIRTHSIKTVIERLLNQDWDLENDLAIPVAKQEDDCQDCDKWEFGQYKNITSQN